MINEEKVRELFNIALCDSKSDDSRVQKQSASYYGWDYICLLYTSDAADEL